MAVDMFMKIGSLEGESTAPGHEKWIEIDSFSWTEAVPKAERAALGLSEGAGKVNFQDFHFTTKVNKTSPLLLMACASGQHFPSAMLLVLQEDRTDLNFMKVKFSEVLISSIHMSGESQSDLPMEQIGFAFAKIEFDYQPTDATGKLGAPVHGGWNIKTNRKA